MAYVIAYAVVQGLNVIPTSKMSFRALKWDKLLGLRGNEDNMNTRRRAELAISRLEKK